MTHRQHMNRDEQTAAVLSARTIACPNCDHGIDPHGIDPGGVCGVGDETGDRCPCLLSPNAIANLLLAAAWDEGHDAGFYARERWCPLGDSHDASESHAANPYRTEESR